MKKMKQIIKILLLVFIASSCTTTNYRPQKNPNKRLSSRGHKCGKTLGSYIKSIKS